MDGLYRNSVCYARELAIALPSVKMVAGRHRHAVYHNKHWQRAS